MFSMISNLAKAAVAVAVTPVTAVVDVLALPVDAADGKDAFGRTSTMLDAAADATKKAVEVK